MKVARKEHFLTACPKYIIPSFGKHCYGDFENELRAWVLTKAHRNTQKYNEYTSLFSFLIKR